MNRIWMESTHNGLNWDVAQYPSYKERPNTFGFPDLHEIGITSTTKQTDAAMKVLETLFSDAFLAGKADVNTALREAEDVIATEMAK